MTLDFAAALERLDRAIARLSGSFPESSHSRGRPPREDMVVTHSCVRTCIAGNFAERLDWPRRTKNLCWRS